MLIKLFGKEIELIQNRINILTINGEGIVDILFEAEYLRFSVKRNINLVEAGLYGLSIEANTNFEIQLLSQDGPIIRSGISISFFDKVLTSITPLITQDNVLLFRAASENIESLIDQKLRSVFDGLNFRDLGDPDEYFCGFNPNLVLDNFFVHLRHNRVAIQDRIYSFDEVISRYEQILEMDTLSFSKNNVQLSLKPQNNLIHINPEASTLFQYDTPKERVKNIFLVYQFTLTNGRLVIEFSEKGNSPFNLATRKLFWQSNLQEDSCVEVLLNKYSDENGLPIIIDSSDCKRFNIVSRSGINELNNSRVDYEKFSKSIPGLAIGKIQGKLKSLDYTSTNFEKKELQLHGVPEDPKELLDHPYWLTDDKKVILSEEAPKAIFGLAKGAWLKRVDNDNPVKAEISIEPVKLGDEIIYNVHGLLLNKNQWELISSFEEKENHSLLSDSNSLDVNKGENKKVQQRIFSLRDIASDAIGTSSFVGSVDDTFEIPATDLHFAASNIYNPETKEASEIPRMAMEKIEGINQFFRNLSSTPTNQEHISKFQRIYSENVTEKISDLFSTLPVVIDNIQDFQRLPLQIKYQPDNLASSKRNGQYPSPVAFLHGKKDGPEDHLTESTDFDKTLIGLNRLWNSTSLLLHEKNGLQTLASNMLKIKQYLDGALDKTVRSERVKVLNGEEPYRLKFETIAKSDSDKKKILQQVKNYVLGNANAIPILGQKLKKLRPYLSMLTIKTLPSFWNHEFPKIDKEDQILFEALFDYIYQPFDRALINNLAQILTLTDIDENISDAIKELENELGPLRELVKNKQLLKSLKTIFSEAFPGVDPYASELKSIWENSKDLENLKARYGKYFDAQTYKRILQDNELQHISALETLLRAKLKNDFEEAIEKVFDTIKENIEKYDEGLLQPYEEEIIAFIEVLFLAIGKIDELEQNNERLFNILKTIKTDSIESDLKKLKPAAREELSRFLYDTILRPLSIEENEVNKIIDDKFKAYETQIEYVFQILWSSDIKQALSTFSALVVNFKDVLLNLKAINWHEKLLNLLWKYLVEKHGLGISLSDLRVDPPQYIVYGKHISFNIHPDSVNQFNKILNKLFLDKYQLCNLGESKWNFTLSDQSFYIVKLGNDMTLKEILKDINSRNKKEGQTDGPLDKIEDTKDKDITQYVHPDILRRSWRGLIVWNPLADISEDVLLRDLAGKSNIKMVYAAIGGGEAMTWGKDGGLDVYARLLEENAPPDSQETGQDSPDANFTLIKFDASIKNSVLESGDIVFHLDFKNIFGKKFPFETIIVKGSLPEKNNSKNPRNFSFTGQLVRPKKFKIDLAFVDTLVIRGVKAERRDNKSFLEVDGSLSFQAFNEKIEIFPNQNTVTLKNFKLLLPKSRGGGIRIGIPRGINIQFSIIEILINKPRPINFGYMEVLPTGLIYIKEFSTEVAESFIENRIAITSEPKGGENVSFTYLKIKLDFGKLTSMGGSGAGSLQLTGILGFTIESNNVDGPYFAIDAVRGEDVTIDLFRFITLYFKQLNVATGDKVTYLRAKDAQIEILGWSPLGDEARFNLLFVQKKPDDSSVANSPTTGFVALADKKEGEPWQIGALKIYWILIARNLKFNQHNLIDLLKNPLDPDEPIQSPQIFKEVDEDAENNSSNLTNLSFTDDSSWLYGASFAIEGFLERCSMILHEQHFYGIMLSSKQAWFEEIFGTETLTLAYIPGKSKEQDRFRVEFGLPALNLISALQSGLIAVEFGINRDFLFDFGFPWRDGNSYLWQRTFSMVGGAYETKFGFYFEKRTETKRDEKELTLGAGVGIYYGYYVGTRNKYAYAEAGIGITVILTGSVTFKVNTGKNMQDLNSSILRLYVEGIIGIYAYAQGGVDYWIFSASFRIEVVAAIQGELIYLPEGNSTLTFNTTISVRYYAKARIKIGFVKKTFRISGHLDYGISGRVAIN